LALALTALTAAPVQIVVATEYLSVEDAQKALFPHADLFSELVLSLNAAQREQVATLAGPSHRTGACTSGKRCAVASSSATCSSMR